MRDNEPKIAYYEEIHYDEDGNEYTIGPLTQSFAFKIFSVFYAALFVFVALLGIADLPAIACIVIDIVLILARGPIKSKFCDILIKTNKYYDDRGWKV